MIGTAAYYYWKLDSKISHSVSYAAWVLILTKNKLRIVTRAEVMSVLALGLRVC